MPDSPEENAPASEPTQRRARLGSLTPEQRRRLGTPRASDEEPPRKQEAPRSPVAPNEERTTAAPTPAKQKEPAPRREREIRNRVLPQARAAASNDLRRTIFIAGAIALLPLAFYVGHRFDDWGDRLTNRAAAQAFERGPDKFPNLSVDELISTGLAAEKRGDWKDARERFLSAKRKNRGLPGILFHIGKTSFDRGDLDAADEAFARAIQLDENIGSANYYRGSIAVRRHDLAAAARFFEAAAAADPFDAKTYYSWAEALRLDNRPRDAIRRYEQASERTTNPDDIELDSFKILVARIEAAEIERVRGELKAASQASALSVEWLMTRAALQLHDGQIAEAAQSISQARAAGASDLFAKCAADMTFAQAAAAHPEIGAAIGNSAAAPR